MSFGCENAAVTTARSLTSAQRRVSALRSTVVLKAAMAVSGLIMVGFLVVHMYGNLKVFSGRAAFDGYARHLRTLGEPFLPPSGALWVVRVVLLASVLVHIYAAVTLWRRARTATSGLGGRRYHSTKAARGVQRTYASFTMRWGGVTVGLFVAYHLLNLSTGTIHPGGVSPSQEATEVGRAGRCPPAASCHGSLIGPEARCLPTVGSAGVEPELSP